MADVVFNSFKRDIANGSIDLDTDSIKGLLVTATYAPDQDAHTKRSDVTNEVTGTNYTSGGVALANKTVTQDNTGNRSIFDADDIVFTNVTLTARACVLYKSRGGASSADELICYLDFGSDKSASAANFTVQFNPSGILALA